MPSLRFSIVLLGVGLMIGLSGLARADLDAMLRARLGGFQEVPAVSTAASGTFRAIISGEEDVIHYELTYEGLEAPVTQAHIHFAQPLVNGGIVVFLCQTAAVPDPTDTAPTCPQGGRVTGTVTAANIIGPAEQGLAAEQFGEFVRALRLGVTYANVHTEQFPRGEIRGQIIRTPGLD